MGFAAVARIVAAPGKDAELRTELDALYEAACEEPGTTRWLLFRAEAASDPKEPFVIVELFADDEAYRFHEDRPVTAEITARLAPLIGEVQVVRGTVLRDKDER